MLIIPDVHGRTFWKEPVKTTLENTDDKIIFLGDYLDPYSIEFPRDFNYRQQAIDFFSEIIELKKQYPDRIILLLGNHDLGYAIGRNICACRQDVANYGLIRKIFKDNIKLFQLAHEVTINGKKFIFSHAGIILNWIKPMYEIADDNNIVNLVNNAFSTMCDCDYPEKTEFAQYLSNCSYYRGGWDAYSSLVWTDINEFAQYLGNTLNSYQIFGHTRAYEPIVTETFAMLDAQRAFYLNNEGKITNIKGEVIPLMNITDITD